MEICECICIIAVEIDSLVISRSKGLCGGTRRSSSASHVDEMFSISMENRMAKQKCYGKDFEKLGGKIQKMAKKEGLIAITNRLKLFNDGKPCRRWWFCEKKTNVLLSVEYGLVDMEAVEFLERGLKKD